MEVPQKDRFQKIFTTKRNKIFLIASIVASISFVFLVFFSNAHNPKVLRFFIVRHSETMQNKTHRIGGWSDAILTPKGEELAKQAGKGLQDIEFQNVYTSDLGRTIATAKILLNENMKTKNLNLISDKRLREVNFGGYEGIHVDCMAKKVSEELHKPFVFSHRGEGLKIYLDTISKMDKRIHDGNWKAESYSEFLERLQNFMKEVAETEKHREGSGNILIVSHGLSINVLIENLFGHPNEPENMLTNVSLTTVEYQEGKFLLEKIGTTDHIEKGKLLSKN